MPTYILLTKLSPELNKRVKDRFEIGHTWLKQINEKYPRVKFVDHYALLGPYDFLDIYEATNEEEAAKVCMISQQLALSNLNPGPRFTINDFLN